jgi:hypothetical protein
VTNVWWEHNQANTDRFLYSQISEIKMKITKDRLREIAETFLRILEKEKAEAFSDLERLAGQAIPVEGREHDCLITEWRPSNWGTKALNIEYIIQHKPGEVGGGIPLNVIINPALAYSQIFLKCCSTIPGYGSFDVSFNLDPFGNLLQAKRLDTVDWKLIQKEIRRLCVS